MNCIIPKVFFQTNKTNIDTYVLNMIMDKLSSEWKYEFYNDSGGKRRLACKPMFPDYNPKALAEGL